MPMISLILTLVIAVMLLWLVNNYIPLDKKSKTILNLVVLVCVFLWLLYAFGVLNHPKGINVPPVR